VKRSDWCRANLDLIFGGHLWFAKSRLTTTQVCSSPIKFREVNFDEFQPSSSPLFILIIKIDIKHQFCPNRFFFPLQDGPRTPPVEEAEEGTTQDLQKPKHRRASCTLY